MKDKQYVTTRTSADGSTRISILGQLVMRFTNANTGASITRNVSGPTFVTVFADGTIRVVLTGRSFLTVDPPSQANSGLPGLVFPTGRFVGIADATNTLVSYSATGQLTDGCALLELTAVNAAPRTTGEHGRKPPQRRQAVKNAPTRRWPRMARLGAPAWLGGA